MFDVSCVCRFCVVLGALLLHAYMAGVTERFLFVNPMFRTVTQLMVVHVVNNLASQIYGW